MRHCLGTCGKGNKSGVSALCTTGDVRILPKVLTACQNYTLLEADEQAALIGRGTAYEPLFALPSQNN